MWCRSACPRQVTLGVLLAPSAALFAATYFVPDALDSLLLNAGFGAHFVGILGTALAAIPSFWAGVRAVYANQAALPGLLATRKATVEVAPRKATYLPGETVRATVRVEGKKDFEVDDARAQNSSIGAATPT